LFFIVEFLPEPSDSPEIATCIPQAQLPSTQRPDDRGREASTRLLILYFYIIVLLYVNLILAG
jgi:hypothetical protein